MKITTARNKLDKLWSLKIREKEYCEVCGKIGNNPHHVVGRRNMTLRFDLRNGVLLCPLHHTFGIQSAHQDPLGFVNWFKNNRPKDLKYLMKQRNIITKRKLPDYLELIEELKK